MTPHTPKPRGEVLPTPPPRSLSAGRKEECDPVLSITCSMHTVHCGSRELMQGSSKLSPVEQVGQGKKKLKVNPWHKYKIRPIKS